MSPLRFKHLLQHDYNVRKDIIQRVLQNSEVTSESDTTFTQPVLQCESG